MQLDDDIRALGHQAKTVRQQLQQRLRMLLDHYFRSRGVFCDADGALTPAATLWLADLARRNFVHGSSFHIDPREHARREGRRELAMEILQSVRLDGEQVRRLKAQLHDRQQEQKT